MKFTTTFSVITLAATAAATPVDVVARTGGGGGGGGGSSTCNSNQQQVCCASIVGIDCLVDILGGNCNGGTYCCDAGGATGGLININALNCVKIL
ncbi:unnamed protein product [Clonostachys rosea]|uniref:Hydrophobin n=1 Tax=Bionectria ochroleuca TaxID=29856 RepID=A0ABY6U1F8_BIOOC|nr:unnamed protein product [Clonostachys rosea]